MTYFNNRRRRRRGRYNNRRRHHHGRRRFHNRRRYGRRRHRNGRGASASAGGLSIKSPVKAAMAGLNLNVIKKGAAIGAGMLGNAWLSGFVGGFLPSVLSSGPGSYLVGLGTAGLLGAASAMVSRGNAGLVFIGGVSKVVVDLLKKYVIPMLPHIPGLSGLMGLADYLTPQAAAAARPLGTFGDYLTPQAAAAARPLGSFGDMNDTFVSEELAAL